MRDDQLISGIIGGNIMAFNHLMERYYGALYVFADRLLNNDPIAEDVVQDVFVDILENRKKFEKVSSVRNYLYTAVRNHCVDIIRKSRRFSEYVRHNPLTEEDLMTKYLAVEVTRQLWEAIDKLPPRTGKIIKLSLEGMRQEKIAEEMGITLATVKSQKREGIQKLRNALGPLFFLLFILPSGAHHFDLVGNPCVSKGICTIARLVV